MSEVKVNKISPRSGTAITLGDSGDTFTIPSGATLAIAGSVTGFTSAGIDDNATSVAITINSSEQVGIGTTSFDQDAKLTIAGSGSGGSNPSSISANTIATFRRTGGLSHTANISVLSGTTGASILNLGDRDDEDIGSITYNHSDNSMAFTTNTSERMRITSAGDVGIGTTNAFAKLVVEGDNNSNVAVVNAIGTSPNYIFDVRDDGTSKFRVDGSGNVGIGETAPFANVHVKVSDSGVTSLNSAASGLFIESANSTGMTIASGTTNVGRLVFADSGNNLISYVQYDHSNNAMSFQTNGSERMRIDSSGNVGIKNTTMASFSNMPGTDLVVGGGTTDSGITIYSGTSSGSNIGFADGASGDARNQGIIQYHHNGDYMRFFTSASEKMRIDSSGNVGIGTSAPQSKLHILQTAETIDDGIKIVGSSSPVSGRIYMNSTDIHIDNATAGQNTGITLDTSGNVGIGLTSPDAKLDVATGSNSGAIFRYDTASTFLAIIPEDANGNVGLRYRANSGSAPDLFFKNDGGSEIIRFENGGNVGIGTSSPTAKLNVNGAIVGGQKGDSSPDNTDVSGVNSLTVSTGAGSQTINGLVGGVTGQVLHIIKTNSAFTLTIADQNATSPGVEIKTADGNNISLTNFGGVTLLFYSGAWWEVGK